MLALTKVYDPRVMRIAACCAILLSFFPKFGAAIQTVPTAIIGGISFVLYGMISSVGVRNIVENQVDFTKSRNLIIAAVILVSALGFDRVGGITVPLWEGYSFTLSGLAIALTFFFFYLLGCVKFSRRQGACRTCCGRKRARPLRAFCAAENNHSHFPLKARAQAGFLLAPSCLPVKAEKPSSPPLEAFPAASLLGAGRVFMAGHRRLCQGAPWALSNTRLLNTANAHAAETCMGVA